MGAELQVLTDDAGRDYMSAGDPAFWRGRAPLLFPVVGRCRDDTVRIGGTAWPMPKHGFARRSAFDVLVHDESSATLRLCDSAATRAHYPFAFALDATFALDGATLTMTVVVRNTGGTPMPASFGFHPAFAWPLPGGSRDAHRIVFAEDEPAALCVITPDGLIGEMRRPSPVKGRVLALVDDLFAADALVWTAPNSRSLAYESAGDAALDIGYTGTSALGIWTKPGAPFVCVEPWAGLADPDGYTGDFADKPGVFHVAPGAARTIAMTVSIRRPGHG